MVGGGNGQFWPQRGEISTNVRGKTMVNCRGMRSDKQFARCVLHVAGAESGSKGIIDDPNGGNECAAGKPV